MQTKPFILLLTLGLFPAVAGASTIYDNGSPVFAGANITQVRTADDFVLAAPATVTAIRFFSTVFPGGGTFAANFSGDISWEFYNNSGGTVGSGVASGSVTGLAGSPSGSFFQVDFDLNSPIAFAAGTYWLELHEGATLSSNDGSAITWAGLNNVPASNARQGSLVNGPNTTDLDFELAFQLINNAAAVPEPSSYLLVAVPLAALLRRRRIRG